MNNQGPGGRTRRQYLGEQNKAAVKNEGGGEERIPHFEQPNPGQQRRLRKLTNMASRRAPKKKEKTEKDEKKQSKNSKKFVLELFSKI